ncbi:MAG TPA: hypothetical protein VKU89_04360 [Solirubrobacteraceae bacterium]|nr:hypothetical protein [Solirubrobacteraceae bacterium]
MSALPALAELIRDQGGLLAQMIRPGDPAAGDQCSGADAAPGPAQVAASGPRSAGRRAEYEVLIEAIYEGYLLHYGTPRVLQAGTDADMRLLAGDRLYALGLSRLVALGDLTAVSELADLITISAQAQEAGEAALASAAWDAAARAVGWGPNERHRRAKALAMARNPAALAAMRACGGR